MGSEAAEIPQAEKRFRLGQTIQLFDPRFTVSVSPQSNPEPFRDESGKIHIPPRTHTVGYRSERELETPEGIFYVIFSALPNANSRFRTATPFSDEEDYTITSEDFDPDEADAKRLAYGESKVDFTQHPLSFSVAISSASDDELVDRAIDVALRRETDPSKYRDERIEAYLKKLLLLVAIASRNREFIGEDPVGDSYLANSVKFESFHPLDTSKLKGTTDMAPLEREGVALALPSNPQKLAEISGMISERR